MPRRWLMLATALLMGAAMGLGAFTFVYAKGYSYITNDPAASPNDRSRLSTVAVMNVFPGSHPDPVVQPSHRSSIG